MPERKVSDAAKQRRKNLREGYPTPQGIVHPEDLDKLYKITTGAVIKMGGPGKIQRVEDPPKGKKRQYDMRLMT